MTERLQQFNEGNSSKPSPKLFLTSSYSPNGTTLGNPLRFLGSRDFHGIFTRKTIDINIILPFRFFLIVRTLVPPSSIDSDQVIDRNTQNQKKKIFISDGKRETTSGLRFPTLQKTACGRCGLVTSTNR